MVHHTCITAPFVIAYPFIYTFFCQILKAMGMVKTASSALNLLIDIGYFPVHVNLDLLKFNIHTDHSDEVISAAESLLSDPSDPDEVSCFLL